jgi:hypothetical protein
MIWIGLLDTADAGRGGSAGRCADEQMRGLPLLLSTV